MRRQIFRALITTALLAVSVTGYTYSTFAKWSSTQVTVYVNPANADVSSSAAVAAIQYAMNVWNNGGTSFHYQYGGTASDTSNTFDNRNVVIFRNASNGSAIASTYTWWNSSNQLLDSDVIVWDGGFTFYTGTSGCGGISNSAYLEDIATHELGHALGLNHSNHGDATMYPSYSYCSQDMRTLASDDVNGLKALYPGGSPNTAPTVSISSPANGATFQAGTSVSLVASAFDAQDGTMTSQITWTDNGTAIGSGGLVSSVLNLAGVHVLMARVTDSGGLQGSSQVSITITAVAAAPAPPAPSGVNVAAASQGATITASSSYASGYGPSALINGDRRGLGYGAGGVWQDATGSAYPDWVQIAFAGTRTIDRVNVFTVQDAWSAPSEPTPGMTWSQWGVNKFTVFYYNGSTWLAVPNGVVYGNSLVWKSITFPPVTTSHIIVWIEGANDGWSRLTEIEAYQSGGSGGSTRVNVAAALQGGTATASSSYNSATYNVSAVINGDRSGVNYGGNGVWQDATGSAYPDWVRIAFAGTRTIDQVNVFTVQDAWNAPSEPTPGMTWSQWGVNKFTVFYYTGSTWLAVPNGVVYGNSLVWKSITFPPVTTSHIIVWIEGANDGWSRLTEVEAYQVQ